MNKEELIRKLRAGEDVNLEVRRDEWGYAPLTWVKDRINLTDVDLSGVDFSNKRISYVDFSGSKLNNAKFNNCDIRTCKFDKCIIEHASFDGAIIDNVVMDDVTAGDLTFKNAEIRGIKITRGFIYKINFSDIAKIKDATFIMENTEMYKCDFSKIEAKILINSSIIKKCSFENTVFIYESTRDGDSNNFTSSFIESTSFSGAKFEYYNIFTNSIIKDTIFTNVEFDDIGIARALFKDNDMSNINILGDSRFINCTLVDVVLEKATGSLVFYDSIITNCNITRTKLDKLKMTYLDVDKSNFDYSNIDSWYMETTTLTLCGMNNMSIKSLITKPKTTEFLISNNDTSNYTWATQQGVTVTRGIDDFAD